MQWRLPRKKYGTLIDKSMIQYLAAYSSAFHLSMLVMARDGMKMIITGIIALRTRPHKLHYSHHELQKYVPTYMQCKDVSLSQHVVKLEFLKQQSSFGVDWNQNSKSHS